MQSASKERFYWPGKTCKNGNVGPWLVSARRCWCEDCKKQHSANVNRWQKKNAEKVLPRGKAWREANKDRAAQHRRKRTEKVRAGLAARCEGDPAKRYFRNAMRRKGVVRATPEWADRDAIRAIYLEAARRRANGENVHVDHIIPLQGETVCGLHIAENLQIIPALDNLRKRNRIVLAADQCDAQVISLQNTLLSERAIR